MPAIPNSFMKCPAARLTSPVTTIIKGRVGKNGGKKKKKKSRRVPGSRKSDYCRDTALKTLGAFTIDGHFADITSILDVDVGFFSRFSLFPGLLRARFTGISFWYMYIHIGCCIEHFHFSTSHEQLALKEDGSCVQSTFSNCDNIRLL